MKIRALTYAVVVAASLGGAGAAWAQSASPSSPSTTPNDGTAVPPNRPVPPGQAAPAPNAPPSTPSKPPHLDKKRQQAPSSGGKHSGEMSKKPREANDNVPRTPAGGATPPPGYPNTGGSK